MAERPNLLEVQDVTIHFGGLVALDHVSFGVPAGTITGLIGPNGAGKTTMFNCITRLYAPSEGQVHFDGHDLLKVAPYKIARLGITRTFQNVALFKSMSVRDNIAVGLHAVTRTDALSNAFRLPWVGREEASIREQVDEMIDYLDLHEVADHPAEGLPFGTLKRIELARALVARPKIVLLDESAGGLNHEEVISLGDLILDIRDRLNVTILLVEHHMNLVMRISDHVVVLDFGIKLAEGPPREIQENPEVIRAYLGTSA